MACNCNKRTRPLGMKPNDKSQEKATGKTQSFTLDEGNGKTQKFNSRLEAEAYKTRNGNRGWIRPA